jgi:hypothetical protein
MWKHWFADHPLTPLALAAMALFVGAFVVAVWRACRTPAPELEQRARLPLLDDGETRHGH